MSAFDIYFRILYPCSTVIMVRYTLSRVKGETSQTMGEIHYLITGLFVSLFPLVNTICALLVCYIWILDAIKYFRR